MSPTARLTYFFALGCALLPLCTGVSIFLLWLLTRWEWLPCAGIGTLYAGTGCFFLGGISLLVYCRATSGSAGMPLNRKYPAWVVLVLLVSNFPAAGGIVAAVMDIETRYTVVIHNASSKPLTKVTIPRYVNIGTIAPGRSVRRSFHIRHEGLLNLQGVSGTGPLNIVIDEYVTGGMEATSPSRLTRQAPFHFLVEIRTGVIWQTRNQRA